jgi:hypothetical protein
MMDEKGLMDDQTMRFIWRITENSELIGRDSGWYHRASSGGMRISTSLDEQLDLEQNLIIIIPLKTTRTNEKPERTKAQNIKTSKGMTTTKHKRNIHANPLRNTYTFHSDRPDPNDDHG